MTATVDRSLLHATGVPEPAASLLEDVQNRYSSVSLEDVDVATGSVALNGDEVVGGCGSLSGSFDTRAVTADLRDHDLSFREPGCRDVDDGPTGRFVAENGPYALECHENVLRVGYGRDGQRALAHLDASTGTHGRLGPANYGSLPSLLSGDAVAYADLGPATRRRLLETLPDASEALRQVVRVASAAGVSLRVRDDGAALRYGLSADPRSLSRETIETVLSEATTGDPSLADGRFSRDGWTVVVDATAEMDSLWDAHRRLLGVDAPEPDE